MGVIHSKWIAYTVENIQTASSGVLKPIAVHNNTVQPMPKHCVKIRFGLARRFGPKNGRYFLRLARVSESSN
jgi:hypothetical protein